MKKFIGTLQSTGLVAGAFALLCLPCILAPLLIAAGLSTVLVSLGIWITPFLLALVAVSLVGFFLSYRAHRNVAPFITAAAAGGILFYNWYALRDQLVGYGAAALLIAAVIADYAVRRRRANTGGCQTCGSQAPGTCRSDISSHNHG